MFNSNIDLIKILIICNFMALLGSSLVIIFFNLYNKNSNRLSMPVSNSMLLVMSCYAACIVALTIVPLPYTQSRHDLRASINMEPVINTVRTLLDTSRGRNRLLAMDAVQNITGNIILFIPLGFLLPIANRRFASYKTVCLVAVCCSASIELTQLFSRLIHNYRQVDIDDVILNTAGAIAGYYIYEKWFTGNSGHMLKKMPE